MSVVQTLLEISTYAAVIFAAILLFRRLLSKRLSPFLKYALWFVLIARLLLPVTLEGGVRLFTTPQVQAGASEVVFSGASTVSSADETAATAGAKTAETPAAVQTAASPAARSVSRWTAALIVYLAGAAAVGSDAVALAPHACEPVAVPRAAVLLKLTSGSTGAPRAIAVGARALAADTVQIMRTMGVRGDDVTLAAIPLTHSYGIGSCLVPLLLAGTPLVVPASPLPAALAAALVDRRVAHFPAVPAMVRALAGLSDLPALPRLRVCLSAGAPLRAAEAEAFRAVTGVKVHNFYGSSECGGITYDRTAAPLLDDGVVGTALDRVTVEVVDEGGRPLAVGDRGRVRVRSRAVALAAVPPLADPGVLTPATFLTADYGVLDAAGTLTLTGRVAEQLNVAGKKVHPEEVRRVLEGIGGVRAACVIGLPDPHRGELVAAVVAVDPGAALTVPAILAGCRARLAPHKVPRRIVLVPELPLTARGKLDRAAVLALLRECQVRI